MRTHIVYENEREVFRGCLGDCCDFISTEYIYTNVLNIHIVIMCPPVVDYHKLGEHDKNKMKKQLSYKSRMLFNKKISYMDGFLREIK